MCIRDSIQAIPDQDSLNQASTTQASTTQAGTSDGGMSQRISLYDVCPRQCRAQGCSLSN